MKWLKNLFKKEVEECKPRWITKDNFKIKKCWDDTGFERYYILCNVYDEEVWSKPHGLTFGFTTLEKAKEKIEEEIKWYQDSYIKKTTSKSEFIDF